MLVVLEKCVESLLIHWLKYLENGT